MMIPTTYAAALILMVLSMLCWGSWANTFKLAGKWRFELFYYDFAAGVLIAAVVAAYTFGSLGNDLTFSDNLLVTGRRNMAFGVAGGAVFNLANMLLVAAISVAGLAVAFPVGIGLALVIGVIWNYILNPQGNKGLLAGGVLLVVGAIVVDAMAYAAHARLRQTRNEPVQPQRGRTKAAPRNSGGAKGITLSLVSGLLMGSFYPLVQMGMDGGMDSGGLGPYAVAVMFAAGVFLSTFIYNLYFLNLPVEGEPISMLAYFSGNWKQHALGIVGGLIWCTGAVANFVAASSPQSVQVGPAVSYAIGQGATMVSALWGLLVWKEFAAATPKVKALIAVMLILFIAGLALVSLAPIYAG